MTCNISPSQLDGFVDGQLDSKEQFHVNTHLLKCQACQAKVEQLRHAKALVQEMTPPPLSANFNAGLQQKLAAAKQTVEQEAQRSKIKSAPWIWLSTAASVTVAMVGLTLFMQQPITEQDLLALDGSNPIIEIHEPKFVQAALVATTEEIAPESAYWNEQDVESFDRFTVVDDGYQNDSCGSTVGDRACTLGPAVQVASLTVNTSI